MPHLSLFQILAGAGSITAIGTVITALIASVPTRMAAHAARLRTDTQNQLDKAKEQREIYEQCCKDRDSARERNEHLEGLLSVVTEERNKFRNDLADKTYHCTLIGKPCELFKPEDSNSIPLPVVPGPVIKKGDNKK